MVYDELGSMIDDLRDKISNLMKITTDKKWATALGQALTAVSNLDRNLSQADAKLGVIPIKESNEINEGRSIEKIQYDWTKLTTTMQATAANWKAAEGKAKDMLLGKLKDMTDKKKRLEAELDVAITDKDKELELVVSESILEKLNVDIVAKKWDELYGEDLKDDYYDVWKKLKAKGSFTLAELEKIWDNSYGESFKDEYDGLYKELMNESLVTEGKTDAIYNFVKNIYDAGSDSGRFTFGTYWKENQGKIIADFNKI